MESPPSDAAFGRMESPQTLSPEPQEAEQSSPMAKAIEAGAVEYSMVLKNLQLTSGTNPILRDVNLAVPVGKVLGILGESGAGKTTLLRLIARKLDESVLSITGEGVLPRDIWYIAQEDVLYEYDTPRGAVAFLHQLVYDEGSAIANQTAENLLRQVHFPLHLMDHCIGLIDHGGISVGARRLINVALGLCSKAKVLILDEPTTGLDSNAAANLISVLREVCSTFGITAMCTIHQPSDEALGFFDSVIVMDEGRAYDGYSLETGAFDSGGALPFSSPPSFSSDPFSYSMTMSTVFPEEVLLSRAEMLLHRLKMRRLPAVVLPDSALSWMQRQAFGPLQSQLSEFDSGSTIPVVRQCRVLFVRFCLRNWTNIFAFRFRFLLVHLLATIIGLCFYDLPYDDPRSIRDVMGVFMAIIGTTFVPIVASAGFFPAEKPSLLNELSQSKRFSVAPYMFARSVYDLSAAVACSASALIVGGMVGIQGQWHRWWLTVLLQAMCSDSFGLMLSVRFAPEVAIPALIPTAAFFSVLIGTALAAPPISGAGWIFHVCKWGSYFKYGFHALVLDQFPLMTGSCVPGTRRCTYASWRDAMDHLYLPYDGFVGSFRFQWLMLSLFLIAQRIITLALLLGIVKSAKFTYKSATNWDAKRAIEAGKAASPTEAYRSRLTSVAVDLPADTAEESEPSPPATSVSIPDATELSEPQTAIPRRASFIAGSRRGIDLELKWTLKVAASVTGEGETVKSRTLLEHQEGRAASGEVLAVLGPASSGKTVLLKLLSLQQSITGFLPDQSTVEITCATSDTEEAFAPTVRFVYQSDAFVPGDSVTDAVKRQLALSTTERDDEVLSNNVESILSTMGISHIADKKASEISGGQLRRLSIACQLAHRPSIMLLDEPTSGLDSELALEVMEALRRFAKIANTIVICTLNQPGKRILPCVDKFLFLAPGGRMAFLGRLPEALTAFRCTTTRDDARCATDVILQTLRLTHHPSAEGPLSARGSLDARPRDSEYGSRSASVPASPNAGREDPLSLHSPTDGGELQTAPLPQRGRLPPIRLVRMSPTTVNRTASGLTVAVRRFRLLVRRNWTIRLADPKRFVAEQMIKFIGFMLLVGIFFIRVSDPLLINRLGVVFIVNSALGFVAFVTPVVLFSLDRVVYDRETLAGDYTPVHYQLARWVFESPAEVVFCTVGTVALHYIVGLQGNLGILIGANLLSYFTCYGLGSAIASLPFSVSVNGGLAAFLIVMFMLATDIIVTPHQISRIWILHIIEVIDPVRHALVIITRSESETTVFGSAIMTTLGLDRKIDSAGVAWALFVANFVGFRMLALLLPTLANAWRRRSINRLYR